MPLGRTAWLGALIGLLTACHSPRPAVSPSASTSPMRLLFVGNSLTYYNGGLENHVRLLAASATPPRLVEADRATQGGATLRTLHGLARVHERIRTGRYDRVILQDDIPEFPEHRIDPFDEFVRLFHSEIRATGARTVLFMAWPYERLGWISLESIAEAHHRIGAELGLPVAPVGLALRRSLEARPGLPMLGPDGEHESLHGTYLAACVIYSTVFEANPVGLPYHPEGVSAEEAAFLQTIAWQSRSKRPRP